MSKSKLIHDFKDKEVQLVENRVNGSNNSIEKSQSKLKHGDDYRSKIIQDDEKFKDKIISDKEKLNTVFRSNDNTIQKPTFANTNVNNYSNLIAQNTPSVSFYDNKFKFKHGAASYGLGATSNVLKTTANVLFSGGDNNDGVQVANGALANHAATLHQEHKEFRQFKTKLDKDVNNQFNDSSQNIEDVDVSDLEEDTDDINEKDSKRKNYDESEKYESRKSKNDRQKQKVKDFKQNEKIIDKTTENILSKEKSKSKKERLKDYKKQQKKLRRPDLRTMVVGGIANVSDTSSKFLRTGDRNDGAEALADGLNEVAKGTKLLKRYTLKTQKARRLLRAKKKQSKLIFKESKKLLKKTESYSKKTLYRKFLKRKRMKQMIRQKFGLRLRDRIKNALFGGLSFKKFLVKAALKLTATLLGLLGVALVPIIIIFMFMFIGGGASVAGGFQSEPKVLRGANKVYEKKEAALDDQLSMETVKRNFPGYDFYEIIKLGPIGHNGFALLSYLTTEKNKFKSIAEVQDDMNRLFNEMYKIKIEKIKWTETSRGENGEPIIHQRKKLKITLKVNEMNKVVQKFYQNDANKYKRYSELIKSQGGMAELFASKQIIRSMGGKIGKKGNIISFAGGKEYDAAPFAVKQVLEAIARGNVQAKNGWCAAYVSNIYENAGHPLQRGNANKLFSQYCHSNDPSQLKTGMIVAVEHADNGTDDGWTYGHVGIYVGNGMIRDNVNGGRNMTMAAWIRENSAKDPSLVRWGFPPGMN